MLKLSFQRKGNINIGDDIRIVFGVEQESTVDYQIDAP